MQQLNFPAYSFRTRDHNGKQQIFDPFRKKYVVLTAEEWVRQNFLAWLVQEKSYPQGLIAVEKELRLNDLKKRYDIVVFNQHHQPALLVECKSPNINITENVFDQAARYNLALKVSYLVVTNGLQHYCCRVDFENNACSFMDHVPDYDKLF